MLYNVDILGLRRKVYQYYKNFNKFNDLSLEDFDRIKNSVSYLDSLMPIEKYVAVMNKAQYSKTVTYDERIASIISCCDPNLFTLTIFEELGSPEKGSAEYKKYEEQVREQIGIFDPNLKGYEAYYRKRIISLNNLDNVKKLTKEQ